MSLEVVAVKFQREAFRIRNFLNTPLEITVPFPVTASNMLVAVIVGSVIPDPDMGTSIRCVVLMVSVLFGSFGPVVLRVLLAFIISFMIAPLSFRRFLRLPCFILFSIVDDDGDDDG